MPNSSQATSTALTTAVGIKESIHHSRTTQSSESRFDSLRSEWTLFAPQREQRPDDFDVVTADESSSQGCPFCAGHEDQTPASVWVGRLSGHQGKKRYEIDTSGQPCGSDWDVRVVGNKFPAVQSFCNPIVDSSSETYLPKPANNAMAPRSVTGSSTSRSLFSRAPARGGHEVIIESNRHTRSLADVSPLQAELVFAAYRDRMRHYRNQPDVRYVSVFKNVGPDAGASLAHSHSQLIATNFMPRSVEHSFGLMRRHRATTGCCLMCDMIREERKTKDRVIARDNHVIAYCPFASHLPMMVRITTHQHQAAFEDLDDESLAAVSRMVYRVISWLDKIRPGTSYNYCLSTKPTSDEDSSDAFHWSIDIFPRLTRVAGFEWASGCMINPMLPEEAAKQFRHYAAAENPQRMP
ncbi:Galactose-1-phosphate uridylyltransferase [Rubripirellula amarantea]|uniref:Galactose-1-phosphate uridylyltransferase n=1 Tax=Rubripirellula amarantea TaxID=2527999 RepID=A0A5C5WU43_9BACT|nr:DUF4921 family protein [Rubripirellula amarantea]TWT53382.1 Galactose-1-phosphate uridylyltransferase [Rubripirellula amarantea]